MLALVTPGLGGSDRPEPLGLQILSSETVEVVSAKFGLFSFDEGGKVQFVPTKTVPLSVDQAYGWIVVLKTNKLKIAWREEFTLPSAPATWGEQPPGGQTVSPDQKVSVLEREVVLSGGQVISNVWTVADGDPKGPYVMRLFIENARPILFEFNVE